MRTKHVNVLIALAAFVLFSFSCFCISRMTQTTINCRNHILEFKEKILRLKNKTERNRQELINALSKMKYEMTQRENTSTDLDRNEDYLKSVVDMITKRFKRQLKSGSLELAHQTSTGFLFFDALCPTKGHVLFTGKLFKSEDLTDFVRFFLMFYKDKPIDLLLGDIFQVKMCNPGETPEKCAERNKQIRIRYKPSLFQHVGIQSSFSGREQYSKKNMKIISITRKIL
ncbi:alpha-1 [Prionailurus iriomotensis]